MVYKSKLYRISKDVIIETDVTINIPNTKKDIIDVINIIDPESNLADFIDKAIINNKPYLIVELLRDREDLRDVISDNYLKNFIEYQRFNRRTVNITNNLVVNDENFRLTYIPKKQNIGIIYELVETASDYIIDNIILDEDINLRMVAMKKLVNLIMRNYPKKKISFLRDIYSVDKESEYPTNETIDKHIKKLFGIENTLRREDNLELIHNVIYYLIKGNNYGSLRKLVESVRFTHKHEFIRDPIYNIEDNIIYYTNYNIVDDKIVSKDIEITFSNVSVIDYEVNRYYSLKDVIRQNHIDGLIRSSFKDKKFTRLKNFLGNDPYKWKYMSKVLISTKLHKLLDREHVPEDITALVSLVNNKNISIDRNMLLLNREEFRNISPEVTTKLDNNILYSCFLADNSNTDILEKNIYTILNKAFPKNKEYWIKAFNSDRMVTNIVRPIDIEECYIIIKDNFRKENLDLSIGRFASLLRLLSIDHFELGTDLSKFDNLYEYMIDVFYILGTSLNDDESKVISKLKYHRF